MKRTSTIILSLVMAASMAFGLVGCGEEEITVSNKTANGISFDVPSDFGEFTEKQEGVMVASNSNNASIAVSPLVDATDLPIEFWNEETYIEAALAPYPDVNLIELDTNASISGLPAVRAHYSVTHSNGGELEGYNYILYLQDEEGNTYYQSITFSFNKNVDSYLKNNIESILSSIKYE